MKLAGFIKAEVSNLVLASQMMIPKLCQRENVKVYNILRFTLCISFITVLKSQKLGGHKTAASYYSYWSLQDN